MLTYTFSRREKALLLLLAIVMVVIVWFIFVYQGTTNRITELEGEISATQTQISVDETRVAQQTQMQSTIDQRKAEGVDPTIMPDYDNMQNLMAELNSIMAAAENYTLSFDQLAEDEQGHVMRGVRVDYTTANYNSAEKIVEALAEGAYPCRIDSVSTNIHYEGVDILLGKRGTQKTDASVHVTFFEKQTEAPAAVPEEPAA